MPKTHTLEEAWEMLGDTGALTPEVAAAVRALLLVGLEEARKGEGRFTKKRYPIRWMRLERLRRRIEELGR